MLEFYNIYNNLCFIKKLFNQGMVSPCVKNFQIRHNRRIDRQSYGSI